MKRPPSNEELKKNFRYSAVVGAVELEDCIRNSKSGWTHEGAWHWMLRRPLPKVFTEPLMKRVH